MYLLGCAMAQAVSRRYLNVRPGFEPVSLHTRFVVDKVALGHFSPASSDFHCQYYSIVAP
jgi:hypothetical protein